MPKKETNPELATSEFLKDLVTDPSAPPNVVVLAGFVGRSTLTGHVRLYLSLKLDEFWEIPEDGVELSLNLERESRPLARQVLWVKRDATMTYVRTTSTTVQAGFLDGAIASRYLPAVPPGPMPGSAGPAGRGVAFLSGPIRCAFTRQENCPKHDTSELLQGCTQDALGSCPQGQPPQISIHCPAPSIDCPSFGNPESLGVVCKTELEEACRGIERA